MKPDRGGLVRLAALRAAARRFARSGCLASPWAASAFGVLLFLLACLGLGAIEAGGAVLLFIPAVAWEASAFGGAAGLAAAALAALACCELLAGEIGTTREAMAVFCLLAAGLIALVNRLVEALDRRASALSEARREAARRETLFAEAQHRIGNNLTMICAALNLQARKSPHPATKRSLQEASERVLLIAEINRMLTEPEAGTIRFDAPFVEQLVSKAIATVGAEGRVRFSVAVEPIEMRPGAVLPIALVLGECVSNALEHGFPGDATGRLEIRLEALAEPVGKFRLTIFDNGAGAPADFDADRAITTGLTLIRTFAHQIDGVFRLETNNGTWSTLTF